MNQVRLRSFGRSRAHMTQRGEGGGWPMGLQPLNARVGELVRNRELSESISFSTTSMLTASPRWSTVSSSELDTEDMNLMSRMTKQILDALLPTKFADIDEKSAGSFFRDKSITLGSLLGVRNILELSRSRIRTLDPSRDRKNPGSPSNS